MHCRIPRQVCRSRTENFCGLFFPLPSASGRLRTPRDPFTPSVAHKRLPCVSVDSQCLQVTFSDVLEAQLTSPYQPLSSCQISMKKVLGDTAVLHTEDTAQPAQAPLHEYDVDGGDPCPLKQCIVGLSLQEMPKMRLRPRLWKELIFFLA